MCGIAGFVSRYCTGNTLKRMGDTISHRGPDDTGYFYRDHVGMVLKRLSIVDVDNGRQPAFNENGSIVVVLNGEIFNYPELRRELEQKGHRMANRSDTAVLPHMYEEYGKAMFERLSGQFAIAVYDLNEKKLLLARDRVGIIPLNYSLRHGEFLFGSEIKAILASGRVNRELSCEALFDVFTYWSPQFDRTIFEGIYSLLPGECLEYCRGTIRKEMYYRLLYKPADPAICFEDAADRVEELLCNAVKKRLIGDVKISTYLSGGLDSSLITAIVASRFDSSVEAFSIGFEEERYDEFRYQKMVCDHLGIKHHTVSFCNSEIPELLKKIVWHTETPLLRAGPVPLYRLSELVRRNSVKVVLSGEGADELFGGYDIFREVKIRNYLKQHPDSDFRARLFRSVNVFSESGMQKAPVGGLSYFYMDGGNDPILESHFTRWRQYRFFERFLSDSVRVEAMKAGRRSYRESLQLDAACDMERWSGIQRSQYLEMKTFLSQYLLSSQGDRVSMANSVEVRFPFLDDDLIEYAMSMNDRFKIKALKEKVILKNISAKYLPQELVSRRKFPYRSPVEAAAVMCDPYLRYLLSEEALTRFNLFHPARIGGFLRGIGEKGSMSEREAMLLMGCLTLQILCDLFGVESAGESMMFRAEGKTNGR